MRMKKPSQRGNELQENVNSVKRRNIYQSLTVCLFQKGINESCTNRASDIYMCIYVHMCVITCLNG